MVRYCTKNKNLSFFSTFVAVYKITTDNGIFKE